MSEGKVNWNYTCPICKKTFPYTMFAGKGVVKCKECKANIGNDQGADPSGIANLFVMSRRD